MSDTSTLPLKKSLRFRQIHLDFHTSPHISGIGSHWNKKHWQDTLKRAAVDSITIFAKCHHGWSYHPTKVGKMHPHLDFDLLRAQYEACKEIDIQAPIYLSAGVDNLASTLHPEWREISHTGQYTGWAKEPIQPGFHKMCFHSPYIDYLCEQIREVTELFPDCDGIFLDIISSNESCTRWALERMQKEALNPQIKTDRQQADQLALKRYYEMTTAAATSLNPSMPVFHNSGHIQQNNLEILKYFSHLELESLPTGGWGYDHFPISIKFTRLLGLDVLGMTGKFHTTWGEFGGYKHPNALRYECAAMLAFGSKCSIGDQLPPDSKLDESTYELIGEAYREVESKEPWCRNVENIADIALLSAESESLEISDEKENPATVGAGRILLEEHLLFDIIHRQIDFSHYRMIILPDVIRVDDPLKSKLDHYLSEGGKLLLTGTSGLKTGCDEFAFDLGINHEGTSPYQPDYILPRDGLRAAYVNSPHVFYLPSQRIKVISREESLGEIYDPWFNRTWEHFCSHQHAPARTEPSGYDCGVHHGNLMYLAHPVFSLYRGFGAVAYREYVGNAIRQLLGTPTVLAKLPSTARINLLWQKDKNRSILHLLHANTIHRGGPLDMSGGNLSSQSAGIDVIEDLIPLHQIPVSISPPHPVKHLTLEPQGQPLPFTQSHNTIQFTLDTLHCHQMIVLHQE